MSSAPAFLSVQGIQNRWSCGRTFVYEAIAEMQVKGYLKRMWLGRHQRITLESVERWETEHSAPEPNTVRSTVAGLRAANAPPPRPAAHQHTAAELRALLRNAL